MDWLEQASKLNAEWFAVQKKMMDSYMSQQGSPAATPPQMPTFPGIEAFTQASEMGDKMAKQFAQFMTPVKQKTIDDYLQEANQALYENYQSAWGKTQQMWADSGVDTPTMMDSLQASMGPQAWWNKLFDPAQFAVPKMTDMASFAGISNYDKKVATAVDEWQDLQKEIANYAYIVMNAWLEANTRFQTDLEEVMQSEEGTKGWREVMDFWQRTADKVLMEMHRSEDFLKAQKSLIEASAAYRLAEQTIADETNKALHIPTRSEVDDLHKKTYELNKELRAIKKDMRALKEELETLKAAPPKKAPARKAAPRKTAAKRSTAASKTKPAGSEE